ncbi:MAG: 4Fe-4S binding protein [Lachnospiraceae bacterium]|nr:4Fe-4S binding protein [Lachnospiraceae bacterium]MBR3003594.1 4Fe-4S binding protein [Lachnospiraceae bacterium]MBR6348909.1 4Fe-4S binding protein [Lachnospiraceae bacterium]
MIKMVTHPERCKSCRYCERDCPKDAIKPSGKMNAQGYEYMSVDEDLCILCGTCYTVCPDLVFELLEAEA